MNNSTTVLEASAPVSDAQIAISGLNMLYGPVQALSNINLTIRKGEFVVLLGASGCGKTTLLRILGGLLKPTSGSIRVDGREMWDAQQNAVAQKIGFVFQEANLFPWMNIQDNVTLPLRLQNVPVQRRREVAQDLCRRVGISGFEQHYPRQLSGGMRQRAAIARALSYEPSILLMDEPFGALDALTREQMNLELQRIWLTNGSTVVLVTHSISEAIFLADRIVVLTPRPGKIETIVEVDFERPRTLAIQREAKFHMLQDKMRQLLGASEHGD